MWSLWRWRNVFARPFLACPLLAGLFAGCLTTYTVQPACACNVPVFRYALQRWQPDPLEVLVLHRAPLDDAQVGLVDYLEEVAGDDRAPGNLTVQTVDLGQLPDEETQTLLEAAGSPNELPWMLVRYPVFTHTDRPAFRGPFDESTVHALVDSPARREIVRRIGEGDSSVWVLIESGDQEQDDAAQQLLRQRLQHLEATVDLSERDLHATDPLLPPDPDAPASAESAGELRLKFSLITVSREEPAERAFVSMLVNSEPDLYEFTEPIVIPIYGRGRSYYALVGQGITDENIDDTGEFIAGACSCEVKTQNPGADMLVRANWDLLVSDEDFAEVELPELTGLGTFAAEPAMIVENRNVEHADTEDSDASAVNVAAEDVERHAATIDVATNERSNHAPAATAPATLPPTNAPTSTTILLPVFGIVLLGFVVLVIGTLVIRIRGVSSSI